MTNSAKCPFCKILIAKSDRYYHNPNFMAYDCPRCGRFAIHEDIIENELSRLSKNQKALISNWIFERQSKKPPVIELTNFHNLKHLHRLSVAEKANRLLHWLEEKYPDVGHKFANPITRIKQLENVETTVNLPDIDLRDLHILAKCAVTNSDELEFLFVKYLCHLELINTLNDNVTPFQISPAGWQHLEKLRYANIESNTIFIAMRFTNELKEFCDAYIIPGIEDAGYDAKRVDREHFSNTIDDEIIALIRKSKLVVSEFTDNSYGVYFETGFARGLNLPIIYVCDKSKFGDKKTKPHFDVEHYPFILWDRDKGPELRRAIQLRIEALVGRGINPIMGGKITR